MVNKKNKKRQFYGLSYREVQCVNSANRNKLREEDKIWLKNNGYRNVGWDNVIFLYKKIEEFLKPEDLTLEELFLEADRIGNKYLTREEIEEFNQALAKEVKEIEEEIDKQFPDTEVEIFDFRNDHKNYTKNNSKRKFRKNIKI